MAHTPIPNPRGGARTIFWNQCWCVRKVVTMTFEELLAKTRDVASQIDATGKDFLAVQVNLKEGGVLYVEVKDGNIAVEPYEYNDRDCGITINMKNYDKLLDGKLDPVVAFTLRKLKVDGDVGKALEFANLLKSR